MGTCEDCGEFRPLEEGRWCFACSLDHCEGRSIGEFAGESLEELGIDPEDIEAQDAWLDAQVGHTDRYPSSWDQ